MPNNLVFNDSAQDLKTQIFGTTSGSATTPVLVANDGTLQIGGTISATIANTVTVTGQVSVTANDFSIRALASATDTVSVTGSVTATIANTVTVTGQVSVTANDFDIRALSATTDTISVGGNGFTASSLTVSTSLGALTNTAFNFDTSQFKTYSFYVVNTGVAAITVNLQVSPTSTETYYIDDKILPVALLTTQKAVIIPGYYLQYTRLQLASLLAASAEVYFNAQY